MNKDMREIFGMKLWSRPEYFDSRRIRAREDFQPEIQTLILKKEKNREKAVVKKFVKIQTLLATPKTFRMYFFVIFFHDIDREGLSTFQEKKIIQQKSRLPRFRQRNYKVQKIGSLAIWHNILGIV